MYSNIKVYQKYKIENTILLDNFENLLSDKFCQGRFSRCKKGVSLC